ncbi:hypothetical protein MNBD_BACTEROID02-232 [hydrothermal vent metagenome]|uniref:SnoaL-like domain-containing protein n=1 Tax=hydrothermal vent metagenome TaxID=652676 RepID=A0A3B0RB43_9ZZZZ
MKTLKKLVLLSFTVILFTACQNNKPERFTTTSPEIDVVKTLVKDYHDGNWEAWLTHYADTAKIYHNTWKTAATPKETIANLKVILANTSSYHFDEGDGNIFYEMVINDYDQKWVLFFGNWIGTLAGNGKTIEIPVQLTLQVENGEIVTEYGFYDISGFTAALQEIEAAKMVGEATTTQ